MTNEVIAMTTNTDDASAMPNGISNAGKGHVVEVAGLNKWFGRDHILKDIDLCVDRGEVICIVGPSGAGKSTFLRTLNHLEAIDSGQILFNNRLVGYQQDTAGKPVAQGERLVAQARRGIGMVFQDFNLFWHMTLLENVTVGPRTVLGVTKEQADERARGLLQRVGLGNKLASYPSQLSGGQQQRGAIARALAMQPTLLLFDEPTSALDPDMSREVISTIEDLVKDGITMIIVSHEISFVQRAATRVLMMVDGQITEDLSDFSPEELARSEGIGAYFQA